MQSQYAGSVASEVTPELVERRAGLQGLALTHDDAVAIAPSLDGLLAFLAPLVDPELAPADPLVHDPRWRA